TSSSPPPCRTRCAASCRRRSNGSAEVAAAALTELALEPVQNERLANLCGQFDGHLRLIERRLGVEIANRGNIFSISGDEAACAAAGRLIESLYATTEHRQLAPADVHLQLQELQADGGDAGSDDEVVVQTRRATVKARGANQRLYLRNIE